MTKFGDTVPVKSWREFLIAIAACAGWMTFVLGFVYIAHNYWGW